MGVLEDESQQDNELGGEWSHHRVGDPRPRPPRPRPRPSPWWASDRRDEI